MEAVTIQSFGGAETVTGSKHLLKAPGYSVLIDCGLFQGLKSLRVQNWQPLPLDAGKINAIILTHGHLDHCGYLPFIIKQGFKGNIFMTSPTHELTELILLDSARIQEEDAEKANHYRYSKHEPALPLYTIEDAEASFRYFKCVDCEVPVKLNDNISFSFKQSGHILGACSVELSCYGKTIAFSGDIGRYRSPILPPPAFFDRADFVVMESTYGDRLHSSVDPSEELAEIINQTTDRGGNILIPSFAVGRAQELIYILGGLKKKGKIPENIPIIMDSPMAATATEVLLRNSDFSRLSEDECRQMVDDVIINRDYRNTAKIIKQKKSKVIIAASGMLTGGRVLEYLKHYAADSRNTIVLSGFQAEGTRGRALLNHTHELRIHGNFYQVNAAVKEISGLSAHADQSELMDWIRGFKHMPGQIILVHGERSSLDALRVKINHELKLPVKIMRQDQELLLFTCPVAVEA